MSEKTLQERLAALSEQLGQETQDEASDDRLAQRTAVYAQPVQQESAANDGTRNMLVFRLGSERYGITVDVVQNIRPLAALTRVPSVPDFYRGIVNLRGQIISVLDLRPFFGMSLETEATELIIVEANDLRIALLADHIEAVQPVPAHQIAPFDLPHTHGVTADRLVILDIEALFSNPRLIIGGEKA